MNSGSKSTKQTKKRKMINELAQEIHQNNKSKGFYEDKKNIGEMLALIHSEVSEALECDRKEKECTNETAQDIALIDEDDAFKMAFGLHVKDTFSAELADIIIRVLDLAAFKNINIEGFIKLVMRNNSLREYKHSKKY